MGDDRPRAETMDVLDHVARLARQRKRRRPTQSERDQMPGCRGDLHGVHHQHAVVISRRIRWTCRVAVVRENHELEARPRGGRGDVIG